MSGGSAHPAAAHEPTHGRAGGARREELLRERLGLVARHRHRRLAVHVRPRVALPGRRHRRSRRGFPLSSVSRHVTSRASVSPPLSPAREGIILGARNGPPRARRGSAPAAAAPPALAPAAAPWRSSRLSTVLRPPSHLPSASPLSPARRVPPINRHRLFSAQVRLTAFAPAAPPDAPAEPPQPPRRPTAAAAAAAANRHRHLSRPSGVPPPGPGPGPHVQRVVLVVHQPR